MLALLSLGSCTKDTVTLRAKISHYNSSKAESGAKVYLDGNTPRWNNGDTIKINGNSALINVSSDGQIASIEVISASLYTAVYPASIATDLTNSSAAQLMLPRLQAYREDAESNQIVATPMCASSSGTTLTFKNMGALLAINLCNETDHTLTIDSVSVRSVAYGSTSTPATAMWGVATANPSSDEPSYSFTASPSAGVNDSVTLAREGNQSLNIVLSNNTQSRPVYVYVPAVSTPANNLFCIRVFARDGNVGYTYVRAQVASGSGNIGRSQKATVPFAMNISYEHKFIPGAVNDGAFTVNNSGSKVYFSKGNLQYRKSGTHSTINGGSATGTWRFAENQWDYLGDVGYSNIDDLTWFDLFGWGTSGYSTYYPYLFTTNTSDYPSNSSSSIDWGYYNAISNGGNTAGTWRTLKKNEWDYLLNTRQVNGGTGSGYSYQFMKVHSVSGLLIYPDGYTQQSNYSSSSNPSTVPAGCVFLPAAGIRTGNTYASTSGPEGHYWTYTFNPRATFSLLSGPYFITFTSSRLSIDYIFGSSYDGCSVRLVRDNPYTSSK